MRTLSRSGGLLACLGAIAASSIAAAAEPAAYPASRTPVVSSAALRAAEATPASSGATADLAQPTFLAPVATSPGGDSSVNVPGLSQPQFLITDHGTPETGNTASNSDWRTHKANPPQSNEAPADPPSAWSLLWRQAAGTNSNASNRYSANNAASQSRPAASARDAATAQNQLDTDSVWSEIKAVKPASSPQRQLSSSDQPGSFDSLVNQLGLSEQTSNSNADVPPTAVGGQNSERLSQTQSNRTARSTSNGVSNTISSNTTQRYSAGTPRPGSVQPAAAWSPVSESQQNPAPPQPAGFWDSLAQPFTLQNNSPSVRRTAASQTASAASAAAQTDDEAPESERVPQLLLPFYQTNSSPQASKSATQVAKARARHSGPDIEHAVRGSKLTEQLAMSTTDDLHAKPGEAIKSTQEAWDSGWTSQSAAGLNPFALTYSPEQPVTFVSQNKTVAYLQEVDPTPAGDTAPEPEKIPLPGDNAGGGDNTANAEGENGTGKKKEELATADKLGEKPVDNSLEFLRTETVLLKPGKYQFDIGFSYTITERDFPVLFRNIDPTNPIDNAHVLATDGTTTFNYSADQVRFKSREFEVPMQLRYGLFKRVQAFIGAPVGWSNTEADLTGHDEFKNDGGIGDINFGATVQLVDGQADCPYVIGTGFVTAPSGGDPFTDAALFSPQAPSLGNGFWKLNGSLLLIQPMDPVTFFYGAGMRGSFEHEYIGAKFEPGLEYTYTFGLGFSINEKVTVSAQMFGEYQSRLQVNGQGIEGSSQEPISLQLAATIARPCDRFIEPFVAFGMTEDAAAVNFGITYTY